MDWAFLSTPHRYILTKDYETIKSTSGPFWFLWYCHCQVFKPHNKQTTGRTKVKICSKDVAWEYFIRTAYAHHSPIEGCSSVHHLLLYFYYYYLYYCYYIFVVSIHTESLDVFVHIKGKSVSEVSASILNENCWWQSQKSYIPPVPWYQYFDDSAKLS